MRTGKCRVWILFLILFSSCSGAFAEKIDASHLKYSGLRVLEDFSGAPKDGVLKSWEIELPEYKSVVYFSKDGRNGLLSAANRIFPWAAKSLEEIISSDFNPDPTTREPSRNGLLALFKLKNEKFLLLHGLASGKAMSYFQIHDSGKFTVNLATFGKERVSGDIPLIAWAEGKDVYKVFDDAWEHIFAQRTISKTAAARCRKRYPEPFKYLGWCSWEQYRRDISSDLLVDAAGRIESSSVPVRWILVDDGHQHQTGSKMGDSRMLSFKANPKTFPNGFKPLMEQRSEKIKWMGIWHTMNAHWQGMHPNHQVQQLDSHLISISKKRNGEEFELMMPKDDPVSSRKFYDELIGSAERHGFDFVKIDNQNRQVSFYTDRSNAVEAAAQNAQSLEEAAEEFTDGLINCFALDLISVMNTKYSSVSRVSVDYLLGNENKAKSHLLQSYQNTLWMGQAVWPDHDMFHSCDPVSGRMMAVSKAVAGAPIYLSDAPKDFVPKLINPLCWDDGELLRPLAPAVPLPDSVMLSALSQARPYRVAAPLPNGSAAVIAYNLAIPTPDKPLEASVKEADYTKAGSFIQPAGQSWQIPEEGLVYYDWYQKAGGKLNSEYKFELKGFSDRFVQLSPIKKGWAVIGRPDKYLSASAVESIKYAPEKLTVEFVQSGPLVVYNKRPVQCSEAEKIDNLGNGLWKLKLPQNKEGLEIQIKAGN
ncbi:Alpha-galactosidase [Sedimentisphaera cyanobacteriorum]|uniref:Alpha-galactosidase n=1 Tax=Sedimentisphaera cyanobacteriorum TaxID=1940790 RepID=A0A1Q2HQJ8_9BACT|nr:Sip1-related alpha-galactosidase [Sedimentisphaera cyanobacteriorum]AQQ09727.1 Alpha-galactosidase [Sedimentisphaera cyanobacteriorum]